MLSSAIDIIAELANLFIWLIRGIQNGGRF